MRTGCERRNLVGCDMIEASTWRALDKLAAIRQSWVPSLDSGGFKRQSKASVLSSQAYGFRKDQ